MTQTMAIGAKRAFFEALVPLVYDQWVISPASTRGIDFGSNGFATWVKKFIPLNPTGALAPSKPPPEPPIGYKCQQAVSGANDHWIADGYENPFEHTSGANVHLVQWRSASPPAEGASVTGRALKSSIDDMEPMKLVANKSFLDKTKVEETALRDRGADPPKSLLDTIFEPITDTDSTSDPVDLGISEDYFFGLGSWKLLELRCGTLAG